MGYENGRSDTELQCKFDNFINQHNMTDRICIYNKETKTLGICSEKCRKELGDNFWNTTYGHTLA
jgi:hypothetical protein